MAGRRVGILAALVWTNRQESLADSRTTMKRSIPWLMCAALAACGGGDGGDRPQPQGGDPGAAYTVQLAGGVPQVLAPESLTLTLAKVDDTRCPAQAQCVWAGQAVLTVNVAQAGQAAADLALSLDATQPKVPAQASYRHYTVRLQSLEPSPPPAGGVPLADYRATVRVERP